MLPWVVAMLTLLVLVGLAVGRNFGAATGGRDAPAPSSADGPSADAEDAGVVRGPDISRMSPRERADHLFDRVMRLSSQGRRDSVAFFAPMVRSAYEMAAPLDLDQHYDLGRIGQVTGVPELAKAEADTILRAAPTHLLGLALAAEVARAANHLDAARQYYHRLLAAEPAEMEKALPEYGRHRPDIEAAVAEAKTLGVR